MISSWRHEETLWFRSLISGYFRNSIRRENGKN